MSDSLRQLLIILAGIFAPLYTIVFFIGLWDLFFVPGQVLEGDPLSGLVLAAAYAIGGWILTYKLLFNRSNN